MALLSAREALAFPGGDNSSDTIINDVHLNLTTLSHWNYTLYSNGSLSNGSWCLLAFRPYMPSYVLPNGTFLNVTWCWTPTKPIDVRGGVAVGYAVLFGIALVLTLVALNKHGRLHLPVEKRFYPIGRRWQWYWGSWVCATAMISLITSIDVDRYFLPELPVILSSFFWYLMQMGTVALVWEAVRHWGSWMERQFIDPDPFTLRDDDRRSKVEFYLPLLFYLFLWLNFFMIVPRNWEPVQHQRYPQQTLNDAAPTATDSRFKAGAFLLAVCWLITVYSLRHSIKYYCPRNRGIFNRITGFFRYTPLRFMLIIPLVAALVTYQVLVAFRFEYSPLKVGGLDAAIFAGGYTPSLLIVYIQAVFGFINPNEDLELQRQRRVRHQALDREMGIVYKPSWWRRVNGEVLDPNASMRDRLLRNVREVQGNKRPAPGTEIPANAADGAADVEMTPVSPALTSPRPPGPHSERYRGRSDRTRQQAAIDRVAGLPLAQREELMMDGPPPPSYTETLSTGPSPQVPGAARSISAQSSASTNQPPQQIRSMLDV
ncbi:hypothetical protein N657DRAFT_583924 [Parathielavia appendiculata]|uniref:Uncharacterized protein n=1 Tax=Parathielavia appendiculata TaxID=2587402 RepID=A0AAN6YZD1_9PEZI|nr:hypothetical protein N657DRAFT_583924 [Parathielavia appendiculata]